jgi:hypothetical protein
MSRGTSLMAVVVLIAALATLAAPALAGTDAGLELSLNTDKPTRGSNVTVTVTVLDVGQLQAGETVVGNVTVTAAGVAVGTADFALNDTVHSADFAFQWMPEEKGTVAIVARLTNLSSDTNASNDLLERTYDVVTPSGVEAGEFTPVATVVGVTALLLFFGVIIASVLGVIPQDRLPVQPALLLAAFVIMALAFIGGTVDDSIQRFGPQQIASKIIIHPITALISGFLVAGALEASGGFEAAADALQRLEALKVKGKTVFGITGAVVLLANFPTIIAMPCGRILAAALMPAALFFGVRVARMYRMPSMVSVVVFAFIVNAAASCGPSLIGGIGTIGEGLGGLAPGSLSDAQQIGIVLCTGVCALVMRFVTVSAPPDIQDEEDERLERERAEAEKEQRERAPMAMRPAGGAPP